MNTATKIHYLRSLNYLLVFVMLAFASALVTLQASSLLTKPLLFTGAGTLVLLILGWYMVQQALDGWLLSALNRTELANDATFDLLYTRSPVAYITLDDTLAIIDFNPATVSLLDTTLADIRGASFFTLFTSEYDHSILVGKLKAKVTVSELEIPLKTSTGSPIWVLLSAYALSELGETLVTLVDVTEQKKVDTAKSEFLALATHQLRTPIAAIRYAVELLATRLADGATERNLAYVDKMNRNVRRMIALINDFLNVSKLEMGTFATQTTAINLTEFMSDIVDEFTDRINNKQISLIRTDTPRDLSMETDPRLLNIILGNIVSNAVKYTPDAGTLTVAFSETGTKVRVEISDSGIGIPTTEIPQLFQKFFRASNATSQQAEGTGLGLYIVAQAVKQLGGTIEVASEVNVGTKFIITLPR